MKTKKIVYILLCIALIFGVIKVKKIKRYFLEKRYYSILVMLDLAKPCYDPYKNREDIFIQEGFDYHKYNDAIILDSLKKISDKSLSSSDLKIPPVTHQIYFTPSNRKVVLKDFYTEKLKANFNKLNALNSNWQHNIWTNNADVFPKEIKLMKGVVIRDIIEFKEHPLYPTLVDTIKKGDDLVAYFAMASDLLRLLALQKIGGIYNDMDYEIYNAAPLFKFMKKFDFIGAREHFNSHSYYGNSFMAAKSNHPVINEAVLLMIRNYRQDVMDKNTPDYIKYPCTENDRLYFDGPPLITLAYFSKNNIEGNSDVILPPWMALNLYFAHYKNKFCDYSKITKEDFIINNDNLNMLLKEFSDGFKMQDVKKHYTILNSNGLKKEEQNIYYDIKYNQDFEIIGADMGCGTWVTAKNPRYLYWK